MNSQRLMSKHRLLLAYVSQVTKEFYAQTNNV